MNSLLFAPYTPMMLFELLKPGCLLTIATQSFIYLISNLFVSAALVTVVVSWSTLSLLSLPLLFLFPPQFNYFFFP